MNMEYTDTEETTEDYFSELKSEVFQYVQKRLLLLRLQATEKASKVTATIVTSALLIITGLFFLVFLSVTIALWIGGGLGSNAAGFGIVSAFYLLVFLIVMFGMKKKLQDILINKLIRLFNKND